MIQTITRHTQLHRANMLDWIRHCDERGEPMPEPEAIATRFGYESIEAAKTLLADLSNRGEISIDRTGTITLSAVKPRRALEPTPRPGLSVKRAQRPAEKAAIEAGVARIMNIINGPKAKPVKVREPVVTKLVEAKAQPAPDPLPAVAREPAPVVPEPAPAVIAQAQPEPLPDPRCPTPQPRRDKRDRHKGRPLLLRNDPVAMDRLQAAAASEKIPAGRKARQIVHAALLDAQAVELPAKPRVPVSVLLASIEARVGLHEFVADMIERGLADWRRERVEATR